MLIPFRACDIPFAVQCSSDLEYVVSKVVGPFSSPVTASYSLLLDLDPDLLRPDDLACSLWGNRRLEINIGMPEKEPVAAAIGCLIVRGLEENVGLLLHGACLLRGGEAHIFVGKPGAGKSTIARNASGLRCVHEEKIAVRRRRDRWWAYGVPMLDNRGKTGKNIAAPLACIYLIEKGQVLRKSAVGRKDALLELPNHVVLPVRDPVARRHLFESLFLVVDQVPVEHLLFCKNSNVADVIGFP